MIKTLIVDLSYNFEGGNDKIKFKLCLLIKKKTQN